MSAAASILYEKQSDARSNRGCGAACLSMVYRSLGKEVAQAEIWPVIAKENRLGSIASTTHLMVKDALNRGFAAVAFQAKHPLQSLRRCHDLGIRAILNHRLKPHAPTGHYTVLIDIDDKNVVLHDPFYGPSRTLSPAELLELWQPSFPNSEIAGYMLIGVATPPSGPSACDLCGRPIPASVECPKCKQAVGLQPGVLLGCMSISCMARSWNYICCPTCDCTWNFTLQPEQAWATAAIPVSTPPPPGPQPASAPAPALDINKLFGELDKFCAYILAIPAAANHPEIRKQLDSITASKGEFKLAHADLLARRAARQAQLAALVNTAKEQEEAHRKKMEELNTPSPPLDGDALGHALLKNLGLID